MARQVKKISVFVSLNLSKSAMRERSDGIGRAVPTGCPMDDDLW
jgi:hypothetical protein